MLVREINAKELDGLLSRLSEAIENNLSLSIKDMKLLLEILQSYAQLSEHLSDNDITLHKLRKLAGLVKSSEKLSNITDKAKADKPEKQKSSKEKKEKPEIEHKAYHLTLCNAHARRQFYDLYNHFPDKVEWLLKKYGEIWGNEDKCHGKNPEERLAYHKEHSLPVLEEIKAWGETMLETKEVEENSVMGKAIIYFIKNFKGLSAFCNVAGAKIDNNEMESMLKLIIRGRKNSLFFKTQAGADIADVLTSLIATCQKQKVNSFKYLTEIQKHSDNARLNPENWLPWNYKDTLKTLEEEKAA